MWSVSSILAAVVSFFVEDTQTYGSIRTSDSRKKMLARESLSFNARNKLFRELFPELIDRMMANDSVAGVAEGSHRNSIGVSEGINRRRRAASDSKEHDLHTNNASDAGSDTSDKLACAVIGVPLTALILVISYALMYGL